jgi:hypothetical protein
MIYYIYAYVREKTTTNGSAGTPYYIGKGKGRRAYDFHENIGRPKSKRNIIIMETGLTEVGALALERRMIEWWGRIDNGTGCLRNRTNGGDGLQHGSLSEEARKRSSDRLKGTMLVIDKTSDNSLCRVSVDAYNNNENYVHPHRGLVPAHDNIDNENKLVDTHLFYLYPNRFTHVSTGKVSAKNKITGELVSVSISDFQECELLVGLNYGKTGKDNYNAKRINIYDGNGILKYECFGNFKKTCIENSLPKAALHRSLLKDKKITKIPAYHGWYALYV